MSRSIYFQQLDELFNITPGQYIDDDGSWDEIPEDAIFSTQQGSGELNSFYGKKHTPETLAKIGFKGRKHTEETKEKMRKADRSYMKTPEYRKKMSDAIKKCKIDRSFMQTPEYREKLSKAMKGKKRSPETRKKISEIRKKYWNEHKQNN